MDVAKVPSTPQTNWVLYPPSSQQETAVPNAKHRDNVILADEADQWDTRQTSSSFDSVVSDKTPSSSLHSNETSVHNEMTTQWILRDNETESVPSDDDNIEAPRKRLIKVNLTDASPSAALRAIPSSPPQTNRISSKENIRQSSYWDIGRIAAALDAGSSAPHRGTPKFDLTPALPNHKILGRTHGPLPNDHRKDEQIETPRPIKEGAVQICSQGPRSPSVVVTGPTSATSANSNESHTVVSDSDRSRRFVSKSSVRTLTSPSTSPRLWLSRNVSSSTAPVQPLSTSETVPSETMECQQMPTFDIKSELNGVPMRFEDDQIIIYYTAEILPIFPEEAMLSNMISFRFSVERTGIPDSNITLKCGEQDVIPEMSYWATDSPSTTLTIIRPREDAARHLNISLAIVYPFSEEGTFVPAPCLRPQSGTLLSERIVVHQPTLPLTMRPSMRPLLSTWTTEAQDENVLIFKRSGLVPRLFPNAYVDHVRFCLKELPKVACANSLLKECFATSITRMKLRIDPMFGSNISCTMKLDLVVDKAERVLVINPSNWILADWSIDGRTILDSDAWRVDEDESYILLRSLLPQDLARDDGTHIEIEIQWEISLAVLCLRLGSDVDLKLPTIMENKVLGGRLNCNIPSATVTLDHQVLGSNLRAAYESRIALGLLHEGYDIRLAIPRSYTSALIQLSPHKRPTTEPTTIDPPESAADSSGGDIYELSDIPEETSSLDGATLNEAPSAPHRSRSRSRRRANPSHPQESRRWSIILKCSVAILVLTAIFGLIYVVLHVLPRLNDFFFDRVDPPMLANGTTTPDTSLEHFNKDPVDAAVFKRQYTESEQDAEVARKARIRQHEQAKAAEAKERVNEVFGSVAYHNAQLSKSANAQTTYRPHGHTGGGRAAEAEARERWYEQAMVKAQKEREKEERLEMSWLAKWNPVEWRRRKQAEEQAMLNKDATEELERYGSQFRNHDKMLRPPIKKRSLRDRVDELIGWAWLVY